jgi:hypothetical protein
MKTIEKYYIYKEKEEWIQINDKNTVKEIRNTKLQLKKKHSKT